MSSPAKAHEPTMEEILASIRRIISDDEPAAMTAPSRAAAEPAKPLDGPKLVAVAREPEADMSDLAQDDIDAMFAAMDAESSAPGLAGAPAKAAASAPIQRDDEIDVLELTDELAEDPEPKPSPRAVPAAPPPSPPITRERAMSEAGKLLSPQAGESVQAAFGNLAGTVLAGSTRTLDDIVSEMLRPMLKAWLDDNLPPLVERLVRQEIERVARGGR